MVVNFMNLLSTWGLGGDAILKTYSTSMETKVVLAYGEQLEYITLLCIYWYRRTYQSGIT
jgi:hypothetical protein